MANQDYLRHTANVLLPTPSSLVSGGRLTTNNIVVFAVVLQAKMVLTTMTKSTDGCKSSQVSIVTKADSRILNLYLASARFISIDVFEEGASP